MNAQHLNAVPMNATAEVLGASAESGGDVPPIKDGYLVFADAEVEKVLKPFVSRDKIGITLEDAERVTDIEQRFRENKTIKSFNEMRYFSNLKSLRSYAFASCSSLESIDTRNLESIGDYAFRYCEALKNINAKNVVSFGYSTFESCSSLESIDTGNLESIGDYAFRYCEALKHIDLNNVTTIPNYAFANCTALESMTLSKVETISASAFAYCSGLKVVDVSNLALIGNYGFNECTALEKFICRSAVPPTIYTYSFYRVKNCLFYVPDASLEAYKVAENWSTYADRIKPISEIEA